MLAGYSLMKIPAFKYLNIRLETVIWKRINDFQGYCTAPSGLVFRTLHLWQSPMSQTVILESFIYLSKILLLKVCHCNVRFEVWDCELGQCTYAASHIPQFLANKPLGPYFPNKMKGLVQFGDSESFDLPILGFSSRASSPGDLLDVVLLFE